jgi:two-component system, NtrC family, response regulator PilR
MNESTSSRASPPAEPVRRAPAVLVVDDEADLRELLSLTLVRLGLDADGAESLTRARQLLDQRRYALVLTDMRCLMESAWISCERSRRASGARHRRSR